MNNLIWGISCVATADNEAPLPTQLHKIFQLLEFSGTALQHLTEQHNNSLFCHIEHLFVRNLLAPGLTREAATQSDKIIDEFKQHFRKLLTQASNAGVEGVTVDFELERALVDKTYCDCLRKLLQSLWGTLYEANINLLFPLRLPILTDNLKALDYLKFKQQLMFSNVFFSIDVHPHELVGKNISIDDFIRWLRFDLAIIRIVYEPSTGNHLVPKLITPWLKSLDKYSVPAKILFAPVISSQESLEHELVLLEEFIDSLR